MAETKKDLFPDLEVDYEEIYQYVGGPFEDPQTEQSLVPLIDGLDLWKKHDTVYESPEAFVIIKDALKVHIPSDVANIVMTFLPDYFERNYERPTQIFWQILDDISAKEYAKIEPDKFDVMDFEHHMESYDYHDKMIPKEINCGLDRYDDKLLGLIISINDPDFIAFQWSINKNYDMSKFVDDDRLVYVQRFDREKNYSEGISVEYYRIDDSKIVLETLKRAKKFYGSQLEENEVGFCLRKPFDIKKINEMIRDDYILSVFNGEYEYKGENKCGNEECHDCRVHPFISSCCEIRTTEAKILVVWMTD